MNHDAVTTKVLLDVGASATVATASDHTALDIIAAYVFDREQAETLIKLLIEFGADVNRASVGSAHAGEGETGTKLIPQTCVGHLCRSAVCG
eukprot:SAG11_NODE_3569_length_2363_cov_2.581272_3_plen_92_part_00